MFKLQNAFIVCIVFLYMNISGCCKKNDVYSDSSKRITNSVAMEMIYLNKGYWVSKYETTQDQFTNIMGFNPSSCPLAGKYPIENMSKEEAEIFCAKLTSFDYIRGRIPKGCSYQLPSYDEWKDYIADAGVEKSITKAGIYGFSGGYDASLIKICEIGSGEKNRLGIYDLRGNVCEMSRDISSDTENPYQIFGACYNTSRKEYLDIYNICYTKERRYDTGFRCVLIKQPAKDIGMTTLHNAIIAGDMDKFLSLIGAYPDLINITNIYGETPVHMAVLCDQYDMAKILISNKADINTRTNDGAFPLNYACSIGNSDMVMLLVNSGAVVPDIAYKGMSCMHLGVRTWNREFVRTLVVLGFEDEISWDLGYKNQYGEPVRQGTAMSVALKYNRVDIASELLKCKVSFDITDLDGLNVLQNCVRAGWVEGVKSLIEKGIDVNFKDKHGHTALYYANLLGNLEIVRLLKSNGGI